MFFHYICLSSSKTTEFFICFHVFSFQGHLIFPAEYFCNVLFYVTDVHFFLCSLRLLSIVAFDSHRFGLYYFLNILSFLHVTCCLSLKKMWGFRKIKIFLLLFYKFRPNLEIRCRRQINEDQCDIYNASKTTWKMFYIFGQEVLLRLSMPACRVLGLQAATFLQDYCFL